MKFRVSFLSLVLFSFAQLYGAGIFLYEISPKMVGLASAGWSARADDASTLFTNPAGMSRLNCPEIVACAEPIYVHMPWSSNGNTTVSGPNGSSTEWIPAGGLYYVTPLTSELSFGIGSFGYFGSVLNYGKDWVGRYYLTKAQMQGYSAAVSASYRVTDCFSVGLGYTLMYAPFGQNSAINNVLDLLPDGSLKLKDHDIGQGYVVGALYEFSSDTRIGLQYLSEVRLNYSMTPKFKRVGPTLLAILTASGLLSNPVKINIHVPQMVMVGFYHSFGDLALMADFSWQQWSKFGKTEITFGTTNATTLTFATKYRDGYHVALGAEYDLSSQLQLCCGVAYDSSIVPRSHRTLSFPVGEQWRIGTGVTWLTLCGVELDAAYEVAWTGDLAMDVNRGPLAGRVAGKFKDVAIHVFNVGITKDF